MTEEVLESEVKVELPSLTIDGEVHAFETLPENIQQLLLKHQEWSEKLKSLETVIQARIDEVNEKNKTDIEAFTVNKYALEALTNQVVKEVNDWRNPPKEEVNESPDVNDADWEVIPN